MCDCFFFGFADCISVGFAAVIAVELGDFYIAKVLLDYLIAILGSNICSTR